MSLLVERRTERIDLGDGDWVEVRVSLSTKEALLVQELQGKSLSEGTFGILELLLVAWSDEAPLTRENIEELKPKKTEEILARLKDVIVSPDPKASSSPLTSTSRAKGNRRMRRS